MTCRLETHALHSIGKAGSRNSRIFYEHPLSCDQICNTYLFWVAWNDMEVEVINRGPRRAAHVVADVEARRGMGVLKYVQEAPCQFCKATVFGRGHFSYVNEVTIREDHHVAGIVRIEIDRHGEQIV